MAWEDRLRRLVYVSPSGRRFEPLFDDLNRAGGRKAPVTEFPGQDQAQTQNLGLVTPRYPMTIYFSGADYDVEADRFWTALDEDGAGRLEHPRWGNISVLALTKEQVERFVDGVGRAVFAVEFIRVSETQLYPRVRTSASDTTTVAADAAAAEISEGIDGVDTTDIGEVAAVEDEVSTAVTQFSEVTAAFLSVPDIQVVVGLLADPPAATGIDVQDVISQVQELTDQIIREIDNAADEPVELAQSIVQLHRLPATAGTSVLVKIKGYAAVVTTLIESYVDLATDYFEFAAGISLSALWSFLMGASESTVTGSLVTRSDAQLAVETLAAIQAQIVDGVERIGSQPNYDTNALVTAVAASAITNLLDRALTLPTENKAVVDRQITPLEFVWNLYGGIDRLDEFVAFNRLTGNQLILLEVGDEVRWYV